ncbi:MAG: tRNA (adenosine(37)-N6)-threonylcarbamoyltransferase complex transferase subunit TsaD [Flavobacteriales bacterium]
MEKSVVILAIESSCDDTSASIIKDRKILSNRIANQEVHAKYGGVVPELASRAHLQNIVPVVDSALKEAGISWKELSAIAFTTGPGLLGSLLVGSSFAQALAFAHNKPLIAVHHMKGHILAHFIKDERVKNSPEFPFLCLTVSGGHTQIVKVNSPDDMEILGETLDDAVGEAFDKSARFLGLEYPGGPVIDKLAQDGDSSFMKFTKPRIEGLNFSFSGLKTNIIQRVRKAENEHPNLIAEHLEDICASIQHTIIEILMDKLEKAVQQTGIHRVAIAGGVSANSELRKQLKTREKSNHQGNTWEVFIPSFEYCTDNAAMIAITAHFQYLKADFVDIGHQVNSRLASRI